MTSMKQWTVLAALAALAILAGGWLLLISPERSEAASLHEQADLQRTSNDQRRTQLAVLRGKAEALPDEERDLAEVARKIPDEPALPTLLRALAAAGRSAGVEVVTITPGTPTPVAAAAGPAPAAPVDPAAATAPAPAAAPPAGLSAIAISIQVTGGFAEVEQYVAELEELPRALRITGLSVAPGGGGADGGAAAADGRSLVSTITGSVFLAPATAAAPVAAAPAVPAAPVPAPAVDASAPAS